MPEEVLAIGKEGGKVGLQSVVERNSCRKEEEENRLPNGELSSFLDADTCDIERREQYHHRHDEMVGYHRRNHHIGK